ncbi:T9SS type A sorting domain-containing protein [Flavobacterium sp.]|uniref:T9SS type A sorting domain-containing protein n=1 Tax=Flavobacterium sp. TaxID=239 RepID=UPI003D14BD9C
MNTKKITLILIVITNWIMQAQVEYRVNLGNNIKPITIYDANTKILNTLSKKAPTLTPSTQTICTGQAITNITANPNINDTSKLDCISGVGGAFANVINNGIFFDITNSGTVPLRINGMQFATVTNIITATNTIVPFAFYKTTSANTAVGNYTNSAAWSLIGTYNFDLPASAASAAYVLETFFNDNGFTIPAGGSVGFYISCNNTDANGFRLAYRSAANSATPISNADITVTHRVRATGLFQTDNQLRGFFGKVLYNTGTYGYWSRNNVSNITGSTNAGDQISGSIPFPISGSLTNNTNADEITTYTVTSFDVNGIKDIQNIYITVNPTPDNTVDLNGNTFTAVESNANYQWFRCDGVETLISGANSQSYTPTDLLGQYKVRITKGPCEIDSECKSITLSNTDFDNAKFINIYPNPAENFIKIESPLNTKGCLINSIGQTIATFTIEKDKTTELKLDNLNRGVYFIHLTTDDDKQFSRKLMITY